MFDYHQHFAQKTVAEERSVIERSCAPVLLATWQHQTRDSFVAGCQQQAAAAAEMVQAAAEMLQAAAEMVQAAAEMVQAAAEMVQAERSRAAQAHFQDLRSEKSFGEGVCLVVVPAVLVENRVGPRGVAQVAKCCHGR